MSTMTEFSEMVRRDWKNPPNLVTAVRMMGALGLPPLVLSSSKQRRLAGVLLFAVLAGTDKLDGWMAKQVYGSTDLGKIMDPIVDKELIGVTLLGILTDAKRRRNSGTVALIAVALVILTIREFGVARIKLRATHGSGKVESAIQSGRVSMVMQSTAVGAYLIPLDTPAARRIKGVLLVASIGASLYSWLQYHRRYDWFPA